MKTLTLISIISLLNAACNNKLKMATYNTFQIPLNPIATTTAPKIITEILNSDIDIMCLQEIFSPTAELQFQNALKSKYPYAYSEANTLELQNVPLHAACNSDQINLLNSACITTQCASQFETNSLAFMACASMICQDDIFEFPLIDTECQYCIITQHDGTKSLSEAVAICSQETTIKYALTGGTIIVSKYPILNKKIHTFHSNVLHRNILITEIDVSSLTRPDEGKDTIFFGCTHLVSTDGSVYFPTSEMEVDYGFTSYNQLNAWQTQNIFNHFTNEPFNSDNHDLGLIIAGDFNVGDMVFPENFNIWRNIGFIDIQDFFQDQTTTVAPCTYCGDVNGADRNVLAIEGCKTCNVPDSDIDHILVYGDHFNHISPLSYNRIFRDLYDINGVMLPLSDHWAVMVEVELF